MENNILNQIKDGGGGENKFKRQQEIDNFKTNYCNNNIKIIRIPYTELNKINKNYIENLL